MYERRTGGFGRRNFDDFDKPKPVKVGQEYDVKISDVGAKGDGITKIENFIVFVPGAKKGEECKIKIKEVSNRFAIGEKVGSSSAGAETEETESTEEKSMEETTDEESSEDSKESEESSSEEEE